MSDDSKVLQQLSEGDAVSPKEHPRGTAQKSSQLDMLGLRAKIEDEKLNNAENIINIMSEMASFVSTVYDRFVIKCFIKN